MDICKDREGIRISKNFIALFTFVIVLLITVSTAVAYTVGVKSSVDNLSNDLTEIKEEVKEIYPKITQNQKDIAVIKAHYKNIDKNIQEIKETLNSE